MSSSLCSCQMLWSSKAGELHDTAKPKPDRRLSDAGYGRFNPLKPLEQAPKDTTPVLPLLRISSGCMSSQTVCFDDTLTLMMAITVQSAEIVDVRSDRNGLKMNAPMPKDTEAHTKEAKGYALCVRHTHCLPFGRNPRA